MGQIVITTPTPRMAGVIDGSRVEVARCGDLWIPASPHIDIVQKGSVSGFEGLSVSPTGSEDATIIAGRFKSPQDPNQLPAPNASRLSEMRRDELEVIVRALVIQAGGKATMDYFDLDIAKEQAIDVHFYQDPFMVKVESV